MACFLYAPMTPLGHTSLSLLFFMCSLSGAQDHVHVYGVVLPRLVPGLKDGSLPECRGVDGGDVAHSKEL